MDKFVVDTELCNEILKLPLEKNPVFAKDNTRLGKKHELSIAERRAFELVLSAALSRVFPINGDDKLTSEYLKFSQKQGKEIRDMTKIILEKYPKNYK